MTRNLLVFMSDDHAAWAVGAYGNREVRTPALDALAASGARFDQAFTPTPVCSPARASFWTGLMPSQHGLHDYLQDDAAYAGHDWLAGLPTLAQGLAGAGYQCGLVGKWHCGRNDTPAPGFERWFALRHEISDHTGEYAFATEAGPAVRSGYKPHVLTEAALDFLRGRDRARPFFLFVSQTATHSPWAGHPEALTAPYRAATFADIPEDPPYPFGRPAGEALRPEPRRAPREGRAQYYAACTAIDQSVGRLLDELDTQGLRDDTLVVYTADHGLSMGQHGLWGKGNATRPLNMLEEAIRVPLIVSQPGPAGVAPRVRPQVRDEFIDHCDLFQTLLEAAGVACPAGRLYPGRSVWPMLAHGQTLPDWKTTQMGEYGNLRLIRTRRHKLVRRYPDGPSELFDLSADPRESTSLFDNPNHRDLVQSLTTQLDAFFARFEDPAHSGLRVRELPPHNPVEAWRGEP